MTVEQLWIVSYNLQVAPNERSNCNHGGSSSNDDGLKQVQIALQSKQPHSMRRQHALQPATHTHTRTDRAVRRCPKLAHWEHYTSPACCRGWRGWRPPPPAGSLVAPCAGAPERHAARGRVSGSSAPLDDPKTHHLNNTNSAIRTSRMLTSTRCSVSHWRSWFTFAMAPKRIMRSTRPPMRAMCTPHQMTTVTDSTAANTGRPDRLVRTTTKASTSMRTTETMHTDAHSCSRRQ
jgi:hypothetical protein